ncbi:MAG: ABC transporter ATP-binding protein, partial [Mycobacteriales bacterium]
ADVAHESFEGALVVKALGRADHETRRFAERAAQLRDCLVSVGRARGLFSPLMDALPGAGTIAVLAVGAYRIEAGAVSLGQLIAVCFLFTVLALPLRAIGWVLVDLPRTTAGADRVRQVLSAQAVMRYGTTSLNTSSGARPGAVTLSFDHVSFSYPELVADGLGGTPSTPAASERGRPQPHPSAALCDVTLQISAGSTVALVGATGSGKSTLVMLAARMFDPDTGVVALDGVDVRDLAAGELPAVVSLVGQSAFAFDDTVRDNLTLAEPYADHQLWDALAAASVADVIAALPEGLDTRVGERGVSLSGGQRQRLALARALLRRPRLLILDDATSSVDPTVEQRVLRGIQRAARETDGGAASTVLLVAHRRASIALADEVIYLAGGRVIAQGRHDELLQTTPGYADLVTAYDGADSDGAEHTTRPEAVST